MLVTPDDKKHRAITQRVGSKLLIERHSVSVGWLGWEPLKLEPPRHLAGTGVGGNNLDQCRDGWRLSPHRQGSALDRQTDTVLWDDGPAEKTVRRDNRTKVSAPNDAQGNRVPIRQI